MKISNITMLIVPFLLLCECNEKAFAANSQIVEKVVTEPEKFTPEQELAKLQQEANAGDALAQLKLGTFYHFGNGVVRDVIKAVEWYERAANQGNASAQNNLAVVYLFEKSVQDIDKGTNWLKKAAEQGHDGAQCSLGYSYAEGTGVVKSAKKAFEWYEKSALQGLAQCQSKLGWVYKYGEGVQKDVVKAAEWYQRAADQGNANSQANLGSMYRDGEGVPKDSIKAFRLFQKAAAQGHEIAQGKLGAMYYEGDGVIQDKVKAYAWFNLAATQGQAQKEAKAMRDLTEKYLTKSERAEGQRLSSNWKIGDTLLASNDVADSDNVAPLNHEPTKQKTGTAFFVSKNGYALTNHHVINGCNEIKIAGRDGVAKLITSDSANDIALLQLPNNNDNFAKINPEPNKLRQGEDVIVFGYPLNSVLSSGGNLTFGTVSALSGLNNNTNQIQITAPIQPGSSGSPVMDKKGDIVGIVSMKLDDTKMAKATGQIGQTINFAVNGQTVKTFLDTNNVPYKTGGGFFSMEKNNADIAEEAKKWTVLVECWK